jgi:hypothetical protein
MEKAIEVLKEEAKAGKLDEKLVTLFIQKVLMQDLTSKFSSY